MKRREFITVLGGAAAIWPLAARAQQAGKVYHIGFLANDPTIPKQPAGLAFLDGLRENGFIEGKNVIIERRFAEGRVDQYELVINLKTARSLNLEISRLLLVADEIIE
jgi:putative tryptophan/tyrosine transport system substrate-binding protein